MNALDPSVVATVKATAPRLARRGRAIVARAYERLFAANPELKALFNPAHMTPDRQIGALAEALVAYAQNLDRLETFAPALERIAQKHVTLSIHPDQYALLGKQLLAALQEGFGAAATPQVMNAWALAYQALADLFIGREKALYARRLQGPGGWVGLREFRVIRKVLESPTVASFYLAPTDGNGLPSFHPGQYVSVHIAPLAHAGAWRIYSLSDRPGAEHFRISVKREARNRFGSAGVFSNHLHDAVQEGDAVPLGPPAGDFFLPEGLTRPVVLLSGGIGIAPLLSMLNDLAFRGHPAPVYFIHGTANGRTHAFGQEVTDLCSRRPQFIRHVRYAKPTPRCMPDRDYDGVGLVNAAVVASLVGSPRRAEYFLCGPQPFMRGLYGGLIRAGIPARRIHFEFFGPHAAVTGRGRRQ